MKKLLPGPRRSVADHEILATTMEIEDSVTQAERIRPYENGENGDEPIENESSPVVLITQDRILRVLARSVYGVQAEELKSVCATNVEEDRSYRRLELDGDEIEEIMEKGIYVPERIPHTNQFYHLVDRENPDVRYCYAFARDIEGPAEVIDRSKEVDL